MKTTSIAVRQTWLSRNRGAATRQERDGSDSNSREKNMDLFQRLWQDGRNGCDNKVAERTWIGVSVNNSNGSGNTSATVEELPWITGPHGSGEKEAEALSRKLRRPRSKYGLAETVGRQQGVSKKAVIATSPAQI